jgi:hypothetical protein
LQNDDVDPARSNHRGDPNWTSNRQDHERQGQNHAQPVGQIAKQRQAFGSLLVGELAMPSHAPDVTATPHRLPDPQDQQTSRYQQHGKNRWRGKPQSGKVERRRHWFSQPLRSF